MSQICSFLLILSQILSLAPLYALGQEPSEQTRMYLCIVCNGKHEIHTIVTKLLME